MMRMHSDIIQLIKNRRAVAKFITEGRERRDAFLLRLHRPGSELEKE